MASDILQMRLLKHGRSHTLVLDPLIGKHSRSHQTLQIHIFKPLSVQVRDLVIASPDPLDRLPVKPLEIRHQLFGPVQKHGLSRFHGILLQAFHFLGRRDHNAKFTHMP